MTPYHVYVFLCADIFALLIIKNDINIGDKKFLLSQYAEDTSIILDASQQSLR